MESFSPPFMSPEKAPEAHDPPTKTKKRNPFELFKKDTLPESPQSSTEVAPENRPTPQRRKRLAAEVFSALRKEQVQLTEQHPRGEKAALPESPAHQKPEEATFQEVPLSQPSAIEVPLHGDILPAPETLPFVARAKEMGRNVMRLIRRARAEVEVADKQDAVVIPTDLAPLADADADVRAAMQELIAPIEAHQVAHQPEGTPAPEGAHTSEFIAPENIEVPEASEPSYEGADGLSVPEVPVSPFVRAVEAVASVAALAGHEAVAVKERLEKKAARLQKFGIVAVGAATTATASAGAAYVVSRLRKLKKEHREMQRENRRFEAEVQRAQIKEERRLHKLEQASPAQLDQPMRQQYVEQVSEFAHQQASEIRTVAHSRELLQTVGVTSVVEQPKATAEQSKIRAETKELYNTQQKETAIIEQPTSRSERTEVPKMQTERHAPVIDMSSPERLKQSPLQQIGAQAAQTASAAASQLTQMITGKPAAHTTTKPPITSVEPKKMSIVQGWPFMLAIAGGAVVFILLLLGIL